MTLYSRAYRLRIRNADDSADELVLTSLDSTGTNPYITAPPTGDGQAIDPITGAATTGAYSVRFADVLTDEGTNTRVFTSKLADARARQQLISRRAYIEQSSNSGTSWDTMVPGYVTATRLTSAIEGEVHVGETRRREAKREIFKTATSRFDGVTCVIGGPVRGGFAGIIPDNGGWRFHVNQVNTSPGYVQIKIDTGFDPRKARDSSGTLVTFTTVSDAIANYTNDWARPYWEPATTWLGASTPIQGHFPNLRVRLEPVSPAGDPIILTPLSEPQALTGPWWDPNPIGDNLLRSGVSSLWLPVDGEDVDGNPVVFAPSVSDTFDVYVYALPISKDNPLHIFDTPVSIWEKLRLDAGYVAGVDYDDTVLAALTTAINTRVSGGDTVKLALRITDSSILADFDRSHIYPFQLSTRITDGLLELFDRRITGTPDPTTVVTTDDLRDDGDTIFDVDDSTVVTAVTLKQLRLRPWVSTDQDQPEADGLIASPWPTDTIENSDDDIPGQYLNGTGDVVKGIENTVTVGDIQGTVMTDDGTDIVPLPFDPFLTSIATEIFDRFGRGGVYGTLHVLPEITERVGEQIIVNLEHRPNAVVGQSPVSQRGGERRVQIVQRTELPEGADLLVCDAVLEVGTGTDTGVGGGTEETTDPTGITPEAPILFGLGGGSGQVNANWVDSYPQFSTTTQFEAHPASETTFSLLYGGEHYLPPGVFSDSQSGIGTNWVVRCRYQLDSGVATSNWSGWSNEVTIDPAVPEAPTDVPTTLVASSTVTDEAHGEWVNTNTVLQIRIRWQASVEDPGPPTVWGNVAGGNRLLAANTTSDDQPTGAGRWGRFKLAYVNSAGVEGPSSDWSNETEIAA